jgi:hypothetical protein
MMEDPEISEFLRWKAASPSKNLGNKPESIGVRRPAFEDLVRDGASILEWCKESEKR